MPKTIINKNRFVCASPSQPAIGLNTNNGGYSRDINMQLIYFTALICNPPKQTNSNKKKRPSPTPIQSLNISQLSQNTSLALPRHKLRCFE